MNSCKYCGAPLTPDAEKCSYCGRYIEFSPEEKARRDKQKQQDERLAKIEALPKIKFVSITFTIFANIFTLGFYAVYWYISRRKTLNNLTPDKKFPDLVLFIHVVALICFYYFTDNENSNQEIFSNIAFFVSFLTAIYVAFQVKNILRTYSLNHLDRVSTDKLIAPSNISVILFGSIYLQSQINKMINLELFAPEV